MTTTIAHGIRCVAVVGCLLTAVGAASGETLAEALTKAQESKRPVLVDFYARWCGPCHELDEKFFPREEVRAALSTEFVLLRVDGEAGQGPELVKRYHVVGYPTLMLLDARGLELDRVMSGLGPETNAPALLLSLLRALADGSQRLSTLEKKLAQRSSPLTPAQLLTLREEVGTRHAYRGDARAIDELRAVGTPSALLTLGKYYYLRGAHDYASAEKIFTQLRASAPKSPEAGQVPYNLAVVYHETARDALAKQTLDDWLAESPTDVDRYNTYAWFSYKNGFDRPRGVEVARQGLALAPTSHALWDTLAELHGALGEKKEAAAAARRALSLKPGDSYYTAQARRFEALSGEKK